MLPCALAFQSPSNEGQDENSNFEFVAEVRGYSEPRRESPKFIPIAHKGRGGDRRKTRPFWLAGSRGSRVLCPLSTAQGQMSWEGGNSASSSFPGRLERLCWHRRMEEKRWSILSKESSRGLRRVS